jgi:hypothetical protein
VTVDLALVESPTLRARYAGRTDVLDRVKALALLPDGVHATKELVAGYYAVPAQAIDSTVHDYRKELIGDGYRVLRGVELREFATSFEEVTNGPATVSPKARSLALFPRRAILRVGMLLRDSPVAQQVRTYLLDTEADAGHRQHVAAGDPTAAAEALELAQHRAQMRTLERTTAAAEVLRAMQGIVDAAWLEAKARHVAARALGEEPEVDPARRPLTVGEYLEERGHGHAEIRHASSRFGKRLKQAYRARYGDDPPAVERFVSGALRQVAGYTEAHRTLFDQVHAEVFGE